MVRLRPISASHCLARISQPPTFCKRIEVLATITPPHSLAPPLSASRQNLISPHRLRPLPPGSPFDGFCGPPAATSLKIECSCGFQMDNDLEFGRLLHWHVVRLRPVR